MPELATVSDDQALRERTARMWPELINCLGCRAEGVKTVDSLCEIRRRALKRGAETCGGCTDIHAGRSGRFTQTTRRYWSV